MDAVVKTDTHVYIFEFKIKKTAAIAFQQILDKKYADKYRFLNKNIIGLGINFDIENKCIDDWKVEEWLCCNEKTIDNQFFKYYNKK